MNQYEQKKQAKVAERAKVDRNKTIKTAGRNTLIILVAVAALGWLGFRTFSGGGVGGGTATLISRTGIHWHPTLTITINGEKQTIPADLGLGAAHREIHTHDTTGTLHVEKAGLVTRELTTLRRFFEIWGEEFTGECILGSCNGEEGTVKMFVNGEPNFEFDDYAMKDGDVIEIVFEKDSVSNESPATPSSNTTN